MDSVLLRADSNDIDLGFKFNDSLKPDSDIDTIRVKSSWVFCEIDKIIFIKKIGKYIILDSNETHFRA